jgi:hypothetical protein
MTGRKKRNSASKSEEKLQEIQEKLKEKIVILLKGRKR